MSAATWVRIRVGLAGRVRLGLVRVRLVSHRRQTFSASAREMISSATMRPDLRRVRVRVRVGVRVRVRVTVGVRVRVWVRFRVRDMVRVRVRLTLTLTIT